jgi:hypothetical protein
MTAELWMPEILSIEFTEQDMYCPACGSYRSLHCTTTPDVIVWRCTYVHPNNVVGHDWMPLGACGFFRWQPADRPAPSWPSADEQSFSRVPPDDDGWADGVVVWPSSPS